MALVPGRQFHPSTFHGTRLNFFRYASSIPQRNHLLCFSELNLTSTSSPPRNPLWIASSSASRSSNWLDRWNDKKKKQIGLRYPRITVNYRRNNGNLQNLGFAESDSSGNGSSGGTTMQRIVEKLKKFGYMDGERRQERMPEKVIEKGSVEDIFYVEEGLLPNTGGGFSAKSPFGDRNAIGSDGEVKFPWEKKKITEDEEEEKEDAKWTARAKSKTSVAELTLPDAELRRLRILTFQTKQKLRIRGGGVTQEVAEKIHERWRTSEIVRLKIEGAAALNMKRVHEILERKTGGLVVWRSGTSVSLYRGVSYEAPSVKLNKRIFTEGVEGASLPSNSEQTRVDATVTVDDTRDRESVPIPEVEYEDEMDKFLGSLGPRYEDWPGCDPLPVDADRLSGIVPGFQPPFRVLPYGVRATLSQKEATALRRLARVLPPHFALGRSRQLQGLAKAIVKLWERSSIAKVALKRGVQLTTSERMAEDIKRLTGGILLSRNKDFLVFYRGKNFLSPVVTEALLERERLAKSFQDEEEQARLRASALLMPTIVKTEQQGNTGTLEETLDANAKWAKKLDEHHKHKVRKEAEIARHADLVRKLERKLSHAEKKLVRGERALRKVEEFLQPSERQADPESITDEERFMFRKLGLRMKAFLLLGRRGVFDGTVENMHLHWKYRELVKIIVKAKTFDHVKKIALALEAESCGVLVSVDKISKGYAIIVFRGKDYERPPTLRPKNLLTKRKALARSIELQRREALLKHVSALQNKVEKLRSEIEEMDRVKDRGGDMVLYDRLDSAYTSDEDDSEEEGDEAYLETYKSESDADSAHNHDLLEEPIFQSDEENDSYKEGRALNLRAYDIPDDVEVDDLDLGRTGLF